MTSVERVLRQALAHGARVYLKDGRLAYKRPGGGLPDEVVEALRRHKDEIVAYLEKQERLRAAGAPELPPIRRLASRDRLALSYAQQRLWFLDRLEGEGSQYNVPAPVRVHGELDGSALAAALRAIVERHESVRTVFEEVDGEPRQVVLEDVAVPLATVDLTGLGPDARERELERLVRDDARRPFDLERELPLRAGLLELAPDDHVILFTMHHIASDAWSMGILKRELGALYEACRRGEPSPLDPLPIQYADYAHWQRQWLRGPALEQQLSYWRRQLAGLPRVHSLPLDRPRPARQGFEGGSVLLELSAATQTRIDALCRARDTTFFMVLQAVFSVLLSRFGHETDVVVGSPIAGRVHRDLEPLVGFFVNTLVLRGEVPGEATFEEVLSASRRTILDAYAHQHVPFEMLVEEIRPERSLAYSPLFQISLSVQNTRSRDEVGLGDSGLEPLGGDAGGVALFDLTLEATEHRAGVDLRWSYKKELFFDETIRRLASAFETLLDAVLAAPATQVGELPLWTPAERAQVLVEWNATGAAAAGEVEPSPRLHELVLAQSAATPDVTALVDGERVLSYGALARASAGVAGRLRALGVGPERVVGVCMERGASMVVSVLGVLAAGGAYLPLDPSHPRERLAQVLADAGTAAVVTQDGLAERLPWTGATLLVDAVGEGGEGPAAVDRAAGGPRPDRSVPPDRENLAYVLFTSGSTGRPKGVAVTHRSAVGLVHWAAEVFSAEELSGVLAATSLSFDLSVFELFLPLAHGGTVILAENALALPELAWAPRVRLVNTVPSAMTTLMDLDGVPASVRTVNLAGEALPRSLADRLYAAGGADRRVWNLYGPSEDTTYSTFSLVARGDAAGLLRSVCRSAGRSRRRGPTRWTGGTGRCRWG